MQCKEDVSKSAVTAMGFAVADTGLINGLLMSKKSSLRRKMLAEDVSVEDGLDGLKILINKTSARCITLLSFRPTVVRAVWRYYG